MDEESKLPKPSHNHFTAAVHSHNGGHFRLALPRKSKLRGHREIRDEDGFLVRHFAGAVCYTTANFIEKNNDALHASLEALVHECKHGFVRDLFVSKDGEQQRESESKRGKLTFVSVGNKFMRQLEELMEKLRSTGTSFVRCIKPNVNFMARTFEGGAVLSQLQCAGMTSVLELMQQGFPSRTQFSELYTMYKKFLPPELVRLDPRFFCKALFKALGLDERDFKFGLTKVFFRPGKFAEFDQLLKSDPENLKRLVEKVKRWILCSRWKKAQWGALSVIKLKNKIVYRRNALVTIQRYTRGYLARKRHAPRYKGIRRMRTLQGQIDQIAQMAGSLRKEKEQALKSAGALSAKVKIEVDRIKSNPKMSERDVNTVYESLLKSINVEVDKVKKMIKDQKIREEQERMRLLQEQMERERKSKLEEERMQMDAEAEKERKQREAEDEKRQKAEIERRRREEEAMISKHLAADREKAEHIQKELNSENVRLKQQVRFVTSPTLI